MAIMLMMSCSSSCYSYEIRITGQDDFDRMTASVVSALSAGEKDIRILVSPGIYYYSEYHLNLYNQKYPLANIELSGQGSVLIAKSADNAEPCPANAVIEDGKEQFCWSEAGYLEQRVEVVNRDSKECRARIPLEKKAEAASYILITQWFRSSYYPISRVADGYVYFTADDLDYEPSFREFNVNNDCYYKPDSFPRYKLFVPKLGHVCAYTVFLNLGACAVNSFSMSGIHFLGNRNDHNTKELLQISSCRAGRIDIKNCVFEGIHSKVLGMSNSANVNFCGNNIVGCYSDCVYMTNNSSNLTVSNNTFADCGRGLTNSACVKCEGDRFMISNNEFRDFGYSAISAGVHYLVKKDFPCRGKVVRNHVYYTEKYMQDIIDNTLMDSGAIYLSTQNDDVLICRNIIHDYTGIKDNRGIFCDDGANNFTIKRNVVKNTPNSFSIDSRLCPKVETAGGSYVNMANVGNVVKKNKVDGTIRFEPRK